MYDFHQLARDVDAFGIDRCDDAVGELAAIARSSGVSHVLIDVLTDGTQPDVARVRALARVQMSLGRRTRTSIAA